MGEFVTTPASAFVLDNSKLFAVQSHSFVVCFSIETGMSKASRKVQCGAMFT